MVSNLCLGTQRRSEHQLSPKNAGFTGGSPSLQFLKRKKVAEADSQPWATWPTLHFLQVTKSHEVKFFKLFTWVCYPTRPTTAVAPLFSGWQTHVKVGRWRVPGAQSHHWGGDHTASVSLPNILAQAPQHARRTTKLSCRCANWGLHFQTHRKNHRTLSRHSKVYSSILQVRTCHGITSEIIEVSDCLWCRRTCHACCLWAHIHEWFVTFHPWESKQWDNEIKQLIETDVLTYETPCNFLPHIS